MKAGPSVMGGKRTEQCGDGMLDFPEKGMPRSHPEEAEGTSAERQRQGYTNEH